MAEKEMQAHDMVRRRSWARAIALYDQILAQLPAVPLNATTHAIVGNVNSNSGSTAVGNNVANTRAQKDRQIACLLGRCECLLELNRYEQCLADARKVLLLLTETQSVESCLASVSRARRWLVHALCKLKKYTEAEQTLREWISELSGQQSFSDITKTLERYKSIIQTIHNSHHKSTPKMYVKLEDEMSTLDTKLDHWATNNLPLDKYSKLLTNKGLKKREGTTTTIGASGVPNGTSSSNSSSNSSTSSAVSSTSSGANLSVVALQKTTDLLAAIKVTGGKHALTDEPDNIATTCSYCTITFQTRNELRQHCQTESHQNVIMSDEGRDWKWRPPPRGFTLDTYILCEAYTEAQSCHYGNQCVEAHGQDELNEWRERFEYRRMRLQKACEKELYGKSYTEQILERWIQATAPERIMCEKVDGVEIKCEQELVTSISSKSSKREWIFLLHTKRPLKAVALLQDAHRNHYAIKSIKVSQNNAISPPQEVELKSNQEWVATKGTDKEEIKKAAGINETSDVQDVHSNANTSPIQPLEHHITIEFHTDIYGTFRQAVCFDFGAEPLLVKNLCVDVVPVGDAEKIEEIKRDIINSSATRWDVANTQLVRFETTIGTHLKTEAYLNDQKHEKEMLERYPCPRAQTFTLTQSTIVEKRLTQNNYRSRIHELLYVEEIARYEQIARYNVRTKLTVTSNYILTPAGMATSTAKYSLTGELFALMRLGKDISEDTSAGRLILSNCSSVYISSPEDALHPNAKDKKRHVYEALIEDKGKNVIYLKLSAKCVEGMSLKADTDIDVDIQFQLNRLPYCEWHNAVDKITDFKIIFPATEIEPNIPWTPKKQWSDACEPKLNAKQREAVNAITTSLNIKLPPILLIGPFGTGKTYTLAQAIKQLLTQPEVKILICTHSNSAADLYIKEYLHPWIEAGLKEATPLRVYYHKRWVATVNSVVQKYCITDGAGNFRRPTVEDIRKHRIVVVTLSISMELAALGLSKGYFTHIFLDEAAQAMECEAIMPLALANDSTRIVLAGDHMQMSPELFSAFAMERKLHISLLERLYDHYLSNFPCKILLCENYRAHEAIIRFTSELFYEQKLIASGKQPRHERFYPLTFFTTRGEDVQDKNSTAFYNNAEVYEVVERVSELRKKWPSAWGKPTDTSIGIMTPYADQVFRIRSELRKRRMGGISVERVLNVQGKQFRAVFLSTVRTRRTCMPPMTGSGGAQQSANNTTTAGSPTDTDADYGFLSNSKLLNTAITRAQSLVAVVGDPVALCSIGRCRKVWERFIEICDENKSLFGITWSFLRSQLDGVELKRGYVLNPLAPEFIPRALQPEAYLRDQTAMYLMGAAAAAAAANNHHHGAGGPHGGAHHNSVSLPPHGGMLGSAGSQIPPHHAAAGMNNAQMPPHMYAQHPAAAAVAYNTAAAAAAAMMNQNMGTGKGAHHFPPGSHTANHMGMRALGPHQPNGPQQAPQPPPPMGQPYQQRGPPPPPVHLGQPQPPGGGAAQFPPYMPWQQAQQQQMRGAPLAGSGGPYAPPGVQQQGPPPQSSNPNVSLWGPPPGTKPWSVLPQPPPNAGGTGAASAGNRQLQPPPPQQQQTASVGMRGSSVPLQPPPPNQQQQLRANPSELGYLTKKSLYGQQHVPPPTQPPPMHGNYTGYVGNTGAAGGSSNTPNNQLQLLNQRNMGGAGMPNGPISPMEPYMQRPPPPPTGTSAVPPQQNYFGNNNINALMKEKDYQFLNNVHMPPLNIGGGGGGGVGGGGNAGNMGNNAGMYATAANKQQSPTALRFSQPQDYAAATAALLPPNMNIYEMAFEPKESQYKWYLKLLETHGQEAANKFTEVLRQVMNMLHQQPPPQQQPPPHANKPQMPPQLHLNAAANNQLLPRELMQPQLQQQNMPPPSLMGSGGGGGGGINHPSTLPQQRPTSMHQFMNSAPGAGAPQTAPSLLPPHLDDTPPLDGGNINLNQHIDLVFNSLMTGNVIAEPILRDLLGMVGGNNSSANSSNSNGLTNTNLLNGDLLLPSSSAAGNAVTSNATAPQQHQHSKVFPMLGGVGGVGAGNSMPPMQHLQPPNMQPKQPMHMFPMQQAAQHMPHQLTLQQQALSAQHANAAGSFMGNNSLLNSKDLLLGSSTNSLATSGASVPLYRRQGMTLGNGNLSINNSTSNMGSANYNGNISVNLNSGHSLSSSTTENLLASGGSGGGGGGGVGAANDILVGLGTAGAGNLIEALFQTNSTAAEHQHQHLPHQAQQQQANNSFQKLSYNDLDLFMREHVSTAGVTANSHGHTHNPYHNHNTVGGGSGGAIGSGSNEQRNTTYAAVLSQGQQQQHPHQHAAAVGSGGGAHLGYHVEPNAGGTSGGEVVEKDPFAAIRELGQGTNGFYNYFQ